MKEFFSNMSLARAIIVLSIPLALVLGWLAWSQSQKTRMMGDDLAVRMPKLASEIQQLAVDHTRYSLASRKDGLVQDSNPETYIRKIAARDKVQIGDVKITKRERPSSKGITDMEYEIRPADAKREFPRVKISNFLYKLEEESRRVKVTSIKLETGERGLKPNQVPADDWTMVVQVTSRQASEN